MTQTVMTKGGENSLQIFICYRQVDGLVAAKWLESRLHERTVTSAGESLRFAVYLDETAAAVADWTSLHLPSLQRAKALIFIATPGAFANIGPEDWVNKELSWWIANRDTAPIVIDTTGQGVKWVPTSIRKKWPNIQAVGLDIKTADEDADGLLRAISSGIVLSGVNILLEEVATQNRIGRRFLYGVGVAALSAVLAATVGILLVQVDAKVRGVSKLLSDAESRASSFKAEIDKANVALAALSDELDIPFGSLVEESYMRDGQEMTRARKATFKEAMTMFRDELTALIHEVREMKSGKKSAP